MFLRAVLCLMLLGGWGLAQNSQETSQAGAALPAVGCTLSAVTRPWRSGHPAIVSIELKNDAGAPVDLIVVPYFSLESKSGRAYTSPVDIVANHALDTTRETTAGSTGVSLKANPLHLHLEKEASLTFKVDANKTKWDSEFSAKWPSLLLSKVAPPGAYFLTLKLWIGDDGLQCNKIAVHIQAARK